MVQRPGTYSINLSQDLISLTTKYVYTSAIFSISLPKYQTFVTCNDDKREAMERNFSLLYAFMCRSGTQIKLPRQLPMSQVSLVDHPTHDQPCVQRQSLSFKPRLYSVMDATSLGTLSVAYKRHRPEKVVVFG